jgi:hypothetical protein
MIGNMITKFNYLLSNPYPINNSESRLLANNLYYHANNEWSVYPNFKYSTGNKIPYWHIRYCLEILEKDGFIEFDKCFKYKKYRE